MAASNEIMLYYKTFQQASRAATNFVVTTYAATKKPKRTLEEQIIEQLKDNDKYPHKETPERLGNLTLQAYLSELGPETGKIIGTAIPNQQYFLRVDYKMMKWAEGLKRTKNPTAEDTKQWKKYKAEVDKGGYGIHFNARHLNIKGKEATIADAKYPSFAAYLKIVDQYPAELETEFRGYVDSLQGKTAQVIWDRWRQGLPVV
ncbi:hypothetical protein RSAG8_10936, partial [Rhizoctonia solani AG-8 WAC10335]